MKQEFKKILLVTQSPKTILNWTNNLQNYQVEVLSCEEIEAAEAMLLQFSIHILITDLICTTKGGLESFKLIRHVTTYFPDVIIIALTETDNAKATKLTHQSGAHFFIEKNLPIKQTLLLKLEQFGLLKISPLQQTYNRFEHHLEQLDHFLKGSYIKALLQPIVNLHHNNYPTLGMESLARVPGLFSLWNPELLFAYAAKKELLFETDMACMKAAFSEAKSMQNRCKLFINVRPHSFVNPDFFHNISLLCEQAGFNKDKVVFELTEQQAIINHKTFSLTLNQLRDNGFGIALDDFGVGFANLQLVQDLRPQFIKLSGIFCRNLKNDKTKQAIVKAITQLAKRLKIETILEHVETKEDLEMASYFGLDHAQGYYFSRPQTSQFLIEEQWFKKHPILASI